METRDGRPIGAAAFAEMNRSGLDPYDVVAQVLTAIRENELYVFTHHDAYWRGELEARFAAILAAMDKAAVRSAQGRRPRVARADEVIE